jgi:acyl transferase domain-containing protein
MSASEDRAAAIVGMAALFPGAPDLAAYWDNLKSGFDAITEAPAARWDPVFFGDGGVDRIYCRRGGFLDGLASFDPIAFGVMPSATGTIEPDQLLALGLAEAALADAGYGRGGRALPRERTGVLLGRGGYVTAGVARLEQRVRVAEQLVTSLRELVPGATRDELARVKAEFQAALGPFGAGDSFVGLVPNLAASRIANRLDLGGPAFTVDAACASSLVAVDHACRELASGRCDVVVAGGVHVCHEVTFWAGFCQLGAVSRAERIRPFDRRADGLLLGEGLGLVVLKRLADAERDGDRVYAVIRGACVTSDGREASLMTPRVEGQVRAVQGAWREARLDPESVGLVEAHGTATPAGDAAELETLARAFGGPAPEARRAGLGSVKSMIGHAMPAAGAAGLIKAALAVFHGVLPPTLHCDEPHPALAATRFRPVRRAEPWEAAPRDRRAGVNAFGFGGVNAHVVLEGHAPSAARVAAAVPGRDADVEPVLLLAAADPGALARALDQGERSGGEGPARLALFEPTPDRVARARAIVLRGERWGGRQDLWFSPRGLIQEGGKIALLFPGVDAGFEGALDDVAARFGITRFTRGEGVGIERLGQDVLEVGRVIHRALAALGVEPELLAGHSIGEWSAMIAAGIVDEDELARFVGDLEPGTLRVPGVVFAAAGCGAEKARAAIADLGSIAISHDNCPHQVIVCGVDASVDAAIARLAREGVLAQKLPFQSGFHSPLFASFVAPHRERVARLRLSPPRVPLWSATTCAPYPREPEAMRRLVIDHLVQPVRFRELVLALHDAGARVLVQAGAGSLAGFAGDTLRGRPHLAIAAKVPQRSGLAQLRRVAAALFVEGARVDLRALLGEREAARVGRSVPLALGAPLVHLATPLRAPVAAPAPAGEGPLAVELAAAMDEVASAQRAVLDALARGRRPRAPTRAAPPAPRRERITRRALSVEAVPALVDHSFYPQPPGWPHIEDRYPVVPLTMTVAMMLEAAAELVPGTVAVRLEGLSAFRWIAVAPPIEVVVRATYEGDGRVDVAVEGYAQGTVIVASAYPAAPPDVDEPLDAPRPTLVDARALYERGWMFHGPAYQGIVELGPVGAGGIDGVLRGLAAPGGLLDNAGQLFGYWVMEQTEIDRLAMPVRIASIAWFSPEPRAGERVLCRVRARHLGAETARADLVLTAGGAPWAVVMGWEDLRFDTDDRSFPMLREPSRRALSVVGDDGVAVFVQPFRSIPAAERLVRRYLGGRERAAYEAAPPRRRYAWLLGRVAAKDAVRAHLWKGGAGPIFPIQIETEDTGEGAVAARGPFEGALAVAVEGSERVAVACIGDAVSRDELRARVEACR